MNKLLLLLAFIFPLFAQAQWYWIDQTPLLSKNNIHKVKVHIDSAESDSTESEYEFDINGQILAKRFFVFENGIRRLSRREKFEYNEDKLITKSNYTYRIQETDSTITKYFYDDKKRIIRDTTTLHVDHRGKRGIGQLENIIYTTYSIYHYPDSTLRSAENGYNYMNENHLIKTVAYLSGQPNLIMSEKKMTYYENGIPRTRMEDYYNEEGEITSRYENYYNTQGNNQALIRFEKSSGIESTSNISIYTYQRDILKSMYSYNTYRNNNVDFLESNVIFEYEERGLLKQVLNKIETAGEWVKVRFEYE